MVKHTEKTTSPSLNFGAMASCITKNVYDIENEQKSKEWQPAGKLMWDLEISCFPNSKSVTSACLRRPLTFAASLSSVPGILDSLINYLRNIFRFLANALLRSCLPQTLTSEIKMSAAADKARYYLEQSVPELKELQKKKIFTPEEITSVAKKRSDFEHKINARGSSPADYAQYAEFEINVDMLRRKRVKRLGIKNPMYNGQRRVFFVFDRGTRKFPGDIQLWMQAIEYARRQQALKKVTQMLTNVLRLHPAKSELWIYAAQFALEENGDMTEARGYMQRGLRFCKNNKDLWLQDFRLELNWIVRIHARRRILGIEQKSREAEQVKTAGEDDNVMMLPKLTAEDITPEDEELDKVNVEALANLESAPTTNGAIPIAIFDAAMEQFQKNSNLSLKFYEEIMPFASEGCPALEPIRTHINNFLEETCPNSWQACACHVSMPIFGVASSDLAFLTGIRNVLARMDQDLARCEDRGRLSEWCRGFLSTLSKDDLDPSLKKVLDFKLRALSLTSLSA